MTIVYFSDDAELFDCSFCDTPTLTRYIAGSYLHSMVCNTCIEQYITDPSLFPQILMDKLSVFDDENRLKLLHYIEHARFKKDTKVNKKIRSYLVTFTYNNVADRADWSNRIIIELSKKGILTSCYSLEHEETNMHAHALITSSYKKTHRDFELFKRKFGSVDVRLIGTDNGVQDYMEKEWPGKQVVWVKR